MSLSSRASSSSGNHRLACLQYPLCPLAKRIPQPKRSGNLQEDNRKLRVYASLRNIVQYLHFNDDEVCDTWAQLSQGMHIVGGKFGDKTVFDTKVKLFCQIPRDWRAAWLKDVSKGELSQSLLDMMDVADATVIDGFFYTVTGTCAETVLPVELREKGRLDKALRLRAQQLGDRLGKLIPAVDKTTGAVDKTRAGPFTWKTDDGDVTSIKHISGDEASIPECIKVTTEWYIYEFWNEGKAQLALGDSFKISLAGLFGEGCGPNKHALTGKPKTCPFLKIAQDLYQEDAAREEKNAEAQTRDKNFLTSVIVDKTEKMKRQARKRALDLNTKRKEAKTVKLT